MTNIFKQKIPSTGKNPKLRTVQDSFLTELLMSLITALSVLSVMIFVKMYLADIRISFWPPFTLHIVAVIHTFIRRSKINNLILMIVLHLAVSAGFYFAVLNIPVLEFGRIAPNKNYLFMALAILTIFSISYRIKPVYTASDPEFIAFPAAIHAIGYILLKLEDYSAENKAEFIESSKSMSRSAILYKLSKLQAVTDAREGFSTNLLVHAVIIALLFLIMRQLAVFESKYYHSIRRESKTSSLLKKQNRKTVIFIIMLFVVAVVMLFFFPYSAVNDLLTVAAQGILGGIMYLLSLLEFTDDYIDLDLQESEEMLEFEEIAAEDPFTRAVAIGLLVIVIVVILIVVIKSVRAYLKNRPKKNEIDEISDDEILIDTIENIAPEEELLGKSHDFGTGYERQVRKRFYDKTRRAMRKGLPVSDASTPGQIESALLANGDKEIASLRKEYEKVRYGKE